DALVKAAKRGVRINMLVADWNKREPRISTLKRLHAVPNIRVKMATIPVSREGFIPYARVIHSKVMRIDDRISWVGNSNWGYDYFHNSRNVEVVTREPGVAKTLDRLFRGLWKSSYAYDVL
ncbi:MAG: phospholipase, partial [bacterium]|nr:phospholipase [bacterium]